MDCINRANLKLYNYINISVLNTKHIIFCIQNTKCCMNYLSRHINVFLTPGWTDKKNSYNISNLKKKKISKRAKTNVHPFPQTINISEQNDDLNLELSRWTKIDLQFFAVY